MGHGDFAVTNPTLVSKLFAWIFLDTRTSPYQSPSIKAQTDRRILKKNSGFRAGNQTSPTCRQKMLACFRLRGPSGEEYYSDGRAEPSLRRTIPTIRGRARAASGPRQDAKTKRKSSETAPPTKILDFQKFLGHAVLALTNPTLVYTFFFPRIVLGHQG